PERLSRIGLLEPCGFAIESIFVEVGENDLARAVGEHRLGQREADPGRRAGHHGDLAFIVLVGRGHNCSPPVAEPGKARRASHHGGSPDACIDLTQIRRRTLICSESAGQEKSRGAAGEHRDQTASATTGRSWRSRDVPGLTRKGMSCLDGAPSSRVWLRLCERFGCGHVFGLLARETNVPLALMLVRMALRPISKARSLWRLPFSSGFRAVPLVPIA